MCITEVASVRGRVIIKSNLRVTKPSCVMLKLIQGQSQEGTSF